MGRLQSAAWVAMIVLVGVATAASPAVDARPGEGGGNGKKGGGGTPGPTVITYNMTAEGFSVTRPCGNGELEDIFLVCVQSGGGANTAFERAGDILISEATRMWWSNPWIEYYGYYEPYVSVPHVRAEWTIIVAFDEAWTNATSVGLPASSKLTAYFNDPIYCDCPETRTLLEASSIPFATRNGAGPFVVTYHSVQDAPVGTPFPAGYMMLETAFRGEAETLITPDGTDIGDASVYARGRLLLAELKVTTA